ncbi:structure-specific recognition protein-domain-containing protein [Desarmillaria ectypa]|nr:structure-specific recognition protein-domain-containing protein [Desarmillaria ectypa]
MTTQFDRIFHGTSQEIGKFRVAATGMAWKGVESEGVTAMQAPEIKWAQWLRVARNFQLRVGLAGHKKETFDGFMREDHDKVEALMRKHFNITLETKEVSLRGWNWGVTDFQGNELAFIVADRTAFMLNLQQVNNSNIAARTEVALEFTPGTSKSKHAVDELTEIRFFVPGTQPKVKGSENGSQKSDDEDDAEEQSAAQVFHDLVKEKAEIGAPSADIILSFDEVLVLTPRGRYDVDMYTGFLRLRGKTYDYKIVYSSISRLFLLPKDDQHVLFILGLNDPIRQGQTRYPYLVMQFTREEEITAELNMSEEDIEKYDRLKKSYEDPTFEVVSSLFRALSGKKIIGAGSFQSRDGHPGIKANLKATQGDLFLLEKYIFFVSKQPTLIELSEIHQVFFSRVATAARTFDLRIVTKNGPEYTFTSINKEEQESTQAYLKDKKIKIKSEQVPDAELLLSAAVGDDDDDDDDDESMRSVDSDVDVSKKVLRNRDDDDDSESDESFEASSSDSGSPTESDSSDGGAATASDASGDRDFKKKKTKKKVKGTEGVPKKKTAKKDGSDAEDDNEVGGKEAPKPKKKKKADDAMDVDGDKPKPKPKPKPKAKPKPKKKEGEASEPPKKKQKTSSD